MVVDYIPEKITTKEKIPLTRKYGRLQPLYPVEKRGKHFYYYCKCDCGNYCIIGKDSILAGHSQSCGCLRSEKLKQEHQEKREKEIIGKIFGQLQVLSFCNFYEDENNSRTKQATYLCKCLNCGKEFVARGCHITTGYTKSCGCVKSHGEKVIIDYFTEHYINYKKEFSFPELKDKKVLRFDFALNNQDGKIFLIEYQGSQHTQNNNGFYSETGIVHDKMKIDFCEKNNIALYIIDYKDDIIVKLQQILQQEGVIYEL